MPHSHPWAKDWAADIYAVLRPKSVIDIGPGAGMWARVMRPRWLSRWTGVEIWEPYITTYGLDDLYDSIIIADARTVDLTSASLVIAGDVLEHMSQSDAESLVMSVRNQGSHLLVSVPIIHYEQGALEGNPYETHLWHPTHEWAMDTVKPHAWSVGDVVGAYWHSAR